MAEDEKVVGSGSIAGEGKNNSSQAAAAGVEAAKAADKIKRPSFLKRAFNGDLFKGALKPHHEKVADLKKQLEVATKQDASIPADQKLNKEAIEVNLKAAEEKLSKAVDKGYKKLTFTQKVTGAVAGNAGKNGGSLWVRGAKGGVVVGAVAYAGKKGIEIFSPKLDEKGEREEGLAMTTIKATVALAAAVGLAMHGGTRRAMGGA